MGGGRGVKSSVQFFFISTSVCILFMILCHLNYYCSRCKIYPYNRLHCWKQLKGSVLYRNYFSYKKKTKKKPNKQTNTTNICLEKLPYRSFVVQKKYDLLYQNRCKIWLHRDGLCWLQLWTKKCFGELFVDLSSSLCTLIFKIQWKRTNKLGFCNMEMLKHYLINYVCFQTRKLYRSSN